MAFKLIVGSTYVDIFLSEISLITEYKHIHRIYMAFKLIVGDTYVDIVFSEILLITEYKHVKRINGVQIKLPATLTLT